ncbi:MAG: hypothetical protein LBC61_02615 [Candidatus Peribacteria bacterium]|jgi:hypothetical protein|nr:hypothetical protein [Candidatus Peribacteria bacterium]
MYKNLSSLLENLNFSEAQKSYLVFLLNKVIISGFNLNVNFETILNLFNKYTEISLAYYQQDDSIFVRT